MASWDSPDLLSQFNDVTGRPAVDQITDASKYARLARSQQAVIEDVAAIYPYCLYRAAGPVTLTTSDSKVYTFGTDAQGNAVAPMGHVAVFRNLSDYPDNPMREGVDFLNEGTQIRIPNDRTEQATLYAHFIPTPADIAADVDAAIRPAPARRLIVLKAAEWFGREGGRDYALADDMKMEYAGEFAKHMLVWRTQFRAGGALFVTDPWGNATKTLR